MAADQRPAGVGRARRCVRVTCGATSPSVRRHADPAAVEVELRAQVEAALAAGIDVTHLDAHMGAALAPEFCDIYLRLGVDYRLPILLTGTLAGYGPSNHLAGVDRGRVRRVRRPGA